MHASGNANLRQYDAALIHWQQVQQADPDNREASRMVASLIIERSRQQAGLPSRTHLDWSTDKEVQRLPSLTDSMPAGSASDLHLFGTDGDHSSLAGPGIRLTRIQQLETAVKGDAANAEVFLELARLYLDKGREYEAERLLARAREATGRDPRILSLGEDVTMLRLGKKVAAAQRDAEQENTLPARTALEYLLKERDRVEIEIFQQRIVREPDNLALRYELGCRYKRSGKLAESRPHLEVALQHEGSRCQAALELAGQFLQSGQPAEALRHFRIAAAAAAQAGQSELQASALFQAGELAASQRLGRLARRYIAELLRVDPSHRAGTALWEGLERGTA